MVISNVIDLSKSFEKKIANNSNLNGEFSFKSQNLVRNYDTNIFEKVLINYLKYT